MHKSLLDILWVLLCASLVFLMQPGFLALESGLTRSKNSINVAIKNITDFCICILLFWLFGFAWMFGDSNNSLFGNSDYLVAFNHQGIWVAVLFLFHVMFSGTAVTIISGAVAERIRFARYLIIAVVTSGLIYPIYGHWVWGNVLHHNSYAWLHQRGFVDFAGSTVVHSVGGWVALAILIIAGPRTGRFPKGGPAVKIPGSNLPVSMLGVLLLWIGWFGFNAGSTLGMTKAVPDILVNTLLASMGGTLFALFIGWVFRKRPDADLVMNGCLAGLVAITASCFAVSALDAALIGGIGGLAMLLATYLLEKFKIDDVVGAVPVHLAAGIWGTLAVAFFADPTILHTGLNHWQQFKAQLLGIFVAFVWAFGVSYLIFKIINYFYPFRVSEKIEKLGLNITEHGASTEIFDFFQAMNEQAKTLDLSVRVPVEPFTEVGQIAVRYNKLMAALEQAVERSEVIVKTARDGIVTFVKDQCTINSVNPAAEAILGSSSSQLIGRSFSDVFPTMNQKKVAQVALSRLTEKEITAKKASGEVFPAELTIGSAEIGDNAFYTGTFRDITERKAAEKKLFLLARYDVLTELPNRAQFEETLNREVARARRYGNILALLMIDIDDFKSVNDRLGHPAGDELLKTLGKKMNEVVREEDFVARIGGDEFAVILPSIVQTEDAGRVAQKLVAAAQQIKELAGKQVYVSISLGIAIFPESAKSIAELVKCADVALYHAKDKQKNNYQYFSEDLNVSHTDRLIFEHDLRNAIANKELFLVYQPKFILNPRKFIGVEALLRWRHPKRGIVFPDIFIPIAEQTGMIQDIGEWVFETACGQYAKWYNQHKEKAGTMSINLSPLQLLDEKLISKLLSIIKKYNVPADHIELELTESAVMSDLEGAERQLSGLRNAGIKLSIDDFGTGYSALSQLENLPIDTLKIDQSFMSELKKNKDAEAIVKSIILLAKNLNLNVIAEGVETKEQADFLIENECNEVQGFYFDKPMSAEDVEKLFKK